MEGTSKLGVYAIVGSTYICVGGGVVAAGCWAKTDAGRRMPEINRSLRFTIPPGTDEDSRADRPGASLAQKGNSIPENQGRRPGHSKKSLHLLTVQLLCYPIRTLRLLLVRGPLRDVFCLAGRASSGQPIPRRRFKKPACSDSIRRSMKGLKPFLSLAVGLLACAIMAGCAGGIPKNGPSALNIAQFTVNQGVIGISYKFLLVVSGGVSPYTWSLTAGQLPPGLSLASDGSHQRYSYDAGQVHLHGNGGGFAESGRGHHLVDRGDHHQPGAQPYGNYAAQRTRRLHNIPPPLPPATVCSRIFITWLQSAETIR